MKKSIVWLASYPKSGNTWTRIFLANYFANADRPLPINEADRFGFGDSLVPMYRKIAGRPIDPHDKRQMLGLRGRLLHAVATNGATVNFIKTHNADCPAFGVHLIPADLTRAAIYILRNPLDVVPSFARHFGITHEGAVKVMGRSDHVTESTEKQVTQYLGSWSDHAFSWTSEKRFPVLVVRYEDMLADPETSFAAVLRHMGVPVDEARLEKAVRFSSFDEVSRQEKAGGFKETSEQADRFFVSGKAGNWQTELAPPLAKKIRKQHRKMMKTYGYLE